MALVLPPVTHQTSVTFRDMAVVFPREEWGHLCPSQKELYWDAMLENYRSLLFLGLTASRSDVIYQLEQAQSPWVPEGEIPATSCAEDLQDRSDHTIPRSTQAPGGHMPLLDVEARP